MICASSPGCNGGDDRADPEETRPSAGIDLQGVTAWHHRGALLEASVVARGARFPEGLSDVELRDARVTLHSSDLTFSSARARIDLETLEGHGEGDVVLEGNGFRVTGDRFVVQAKDRSFEMHSGVHVEARGS